ncbi:MAG TPA: enoyl-CoA hydratase [Gammaproteobacteria bacterium]|nr:enoyl-CoA hydratase [Gammaproteobacteria bacterium]
MSDTRLGRSTKAATSQRDASLFSTRFHSEYGALWGFIEADAPVCFSPALIRAMRERQQAFAEQVARETAAGHTNPARYQVLASRLPGIFSLGGDLAHFARLVETCDREGLVRYGIDCVDLVYWTAAGYGLPVTTIALVQGTAQGGGFEAALAAHVLIAERQCQFGFPEVLFNLFPGMGAAHFLLRRVSQPIAWEILSSGRMYSAEELHRMGIVDILVDTGEGEQAVRQYIRRNDNRHRGLNAMRQVLQRAQPIEREELVRTVQEWADLALKMDARDLKTIRRLQRAQTRLRGTPQA